MFIPLQLGVVVITQSLELLTSAYTASSSGKERLCVCVCVCVCVGGGGGGDGGKESVEGMVGLLTSKWLADLPAKVNEGLVQHLLAALQFGCSRRQTLNTSPTREVSSLILVLIELASSYRSSIFSLLCCRQPTIIIEHMEAPLTIYL